MTSHIDELIVRVSIVENSLREILPICDDVKERVTSLEAHNDNLKEDIGEIRNAQEKGIKERQKQYETLVTKINDAMTYNDERLLRTFKPVETQLERIATAWQTLVYVAGFVAGSVAIIVGIVSVLPK